MGDIRQIQKLTKQGRQYTRMPIKLESKDDYRFTLKYTNAFMAVKKEIRKADFNLDIMNVYKTRDKITEDGCYTLGKELSKGPEIADVDSVLKETTGNKIVLNRKMLIDTLVLLDGERVELSIGAGKMEPISIKSRTGLAVIMGVKLVEDEL